MIGMETPSLPEPSALGTNKYWNDLYTSELHTHSADPTNEGSNWFLESDAESKISAYCHALLVSGHFSHPSSTSLSPPALASASPSLPALASISPSLPPLASTSPPLPPLASASTGRGLRILDIGTGNGSLLFALKAQGFDEAACFGLDYAAKSVELAREIQKVRRDRRVRRIKRVARGLRDGSAEQRGGVPWVRGEREEEEREREWGEDEDEDEDEDDEQDGNGDEEEEEEEVQKDVEGEMVGELPLPWTDVQFVQRDFLSDNMGEFGEFDLVLDKGTFDAVSLSGESWEAPREMQLPVVAEARREEKRVPDGAGVLVETACERYVRVASTLVKRDTGRLIVTSCNWTKAELVSWFEGPGLLEVCDEVKYRTFTFGGVTGQTVTTLVFRQRPL